MRLRGWLLAGLLWLAPAASGGDGGAAAALEGRRWQWVSFLGPDGKPLVPPQPDRYWIELLPAGQLELLADCNRGTGRWSAEGREVTLQPLATTLMACPPGSLDSRFTQLLGQASRFEVQGQELVVTLRGGAGVMRLARVQGEAGPELQGARWGWVRFLGSDDSTVVPDDPAKYELDFLADGKLRLRADCNRGGGTWSADATRRLRLDAAVLTRAMCPPGSLSDRFVKLLGQASSYLFRDDQLVIVLRVDTGSMFFSRLPAPQPSR